MSTRAWIAGARLPTLPAAVGPVLMGGGLAWWAGRFEPLPFTAALVAALFIQIGTNLANDYSDYVRGADTAERLGSPRVTQTGQLRPERVKAGAALCFGLALAVGVYLVVRAGWPIVWIGLASIAAGVLYTGGPWPFGYHALGDVFAFVFFGPVAVAGTYYVQTLEWSVGALWAGVGVGAITTAILVVNNLRDRDTDRAAGKRTVAVLIGRRASQLEYTALFAVGGLVPLLGVLRGGWPHATLLAWGALALAIPALHTLWTYRDPRLLNPVLRATARAAGLYGLLFAIGCLA